MTRQPASPLPIFRSAYGFSGRLLLAALVALFVLPAMLESLGWDQAIESVLFTVVMLAALLAVSNHRVRAGGYLVLSPPLAMLWLQHFHLIAKGGPLTIAYLGYLVILVAVTVWRLLRFVLIVKEVDAEALAAGVSIYLLLGLLWSFLYLSLSVVQATPFKGELSAAGGGLSQADTFYFSLCTLTTAGYGDITPLTHQARILAVMESVTGVLYVGVLIARLVSLYSQAKPVAEKG